MLESRESSSPILTRAINAALQGKYSNSYFFNNYERIALWLLGSFPQKYSQWLIPRIQAPKALTNYAVKNISLVDLISERLADYSNLKGKYKSVTMGAAIGGAAGHLAMALNGPFLPQSFVMTLRGGTKNGDIEEYFFRSANVAKEFTERNPQVISVQHFDPVHDGWLTHSVNHLRLKLIDLPKQYKEFLKKYLNPGGEIIYLDGNIHWLQYIVGKNNYFQVGGWGGVSSREYLDGSERLTIYRKKNGLSEKPWKLQNYEPVLGYESEWGSEPGLLEKLEDFCQSEGFRLFRISFDNPHKFAKLAFLSYQTLLEKNGLKPKGIIIEMFSQYDLTAVNESCLLPLWLIFNTEDSLEFLKSMKIYFPDDPKIFFSPLATFSTTPDFIDFQQWEDCLFPFEWDNIGCRASHYPADTRALITWSKPLREWSQQNRIRLEKYLSGEDLLEIANSMS